ncbi:hypothetical protein B5M09_012827, partial [Aphanomyces astaci]
MGQTDVYLHNAPALPKHPKFKGSTKEERRTFMAAYNLYISQTTALTVNGTKPFVMPVNACIDPASKQRIAEWDMGKGPYEVTDCEAEWVAWFRQGYDVDPQALDTLKKRIKAAVVFVMSVHDADSRIGNMLDGLAAAIRRDRREWVIKEESPAIVKIITDAVKPVSLYRAVTEQMALTRNKPLKKEYTVSYGDCRSTRSGTNGSSVTKKIRRQLRSRIRPRRTKAVHTTPYGSDSVDTTGTSDSDDAPGATWADVSEWLSEVQIYEPSPDLSVPSGGLVSALLAAGAAPEITTMGPFSLRPYGADSRPVVVTKQVRFGSLEFKPGCGPLMLRGLRVWVDEAVAGVELTLGLPVMQKLDYSDNTLLENAHRQQAEWHFADQSIATPGEAMHRTLRMEETLVDDIDDDEGMCCATPDWGTDPYPTDGQVDDHP